MEASSMEIHPGITMDSDVRFWQALYQGHKNRCRNVLGRFAAGDKIEDIQKLIRRR
jgi:uncharacterized protein (DUF433 family)